MVYSAKSDSGNTIKEFTRRKKITISPTGTSTPTNYQVKLIIDYSNNMQSNFQDIRFNTKEGNYIDYYIEVLTVSTTVTVWIELPDAIIDPGSDYIYMYYGNSGLSDGSMGADTFPNFFENAETGLFTDQWTIVSGSAAFSATRAFSGSQSIRSPSNSIIKTTVSWADATGIIQAMFYDEDVTDANSYLNILSNSNQDWALVGLTNTDINNYRFYHDGTWFDTGTARSAGWHKLVIVHGGTFVKFYIDDNEEGEDASPAYSTFDQLQIQCGHVGGTEILYYDDIFVRKYIINEPTTSYGIEEHQRRTPQFIN